MSHDTAATINRLKKLTRGVLAQPLVIRIHDADEHESLVNGNPVASVVVDHTFEIYPDTDMDGKPLWVVDRIVEDNDPEVGMFGSEPEVWCSFNTLDAALMKTALAAAQQHMEQVWQREAEDEMVAELQRYESSTALGYE